MLHIAIVETETVAKDYVFEIGKILHSYAWDFMYFRSIMDFFKELQISSFDVVIFHEQFQTHRIYETLIKDKPYTVIFSCDHPQSDHPALDIYFFDRHHLDANRLKDVILPVVKRQEDFFFSYNDVKIMMKIQDVQYIEKQDKYLIYHTNLGEFKERGNMSDLVKRLQEYGFVHIHVSFLVNGSFLSGLEGDEVILKDQTRLPISRSKFHTVKEYFAQKKLPFQ